MNLFYRRDIGFRVILVFGFLLLLNSKGAIVLFETGFEQGDGYKIGMSLGKTPPWQTRYNEGSGVIKRWPEKGQQGFIGGKAPRENSLIVGLPVAAGDTDLPTVSVNMKISLTASTLGVESEFGLLFSRPDTRCVAGVLFDNLEERLYVSLDGDTFVSPDVRFSRDSIYDLSLYFDFATLQWDAFLDGAAIVYGEPLPKSTTDVTLIELFWLYDIFGPSDNQMLLDDVKVVKGGSNRRNIPEAKIQRSGATSVQISVVGQTADIYSIESSTDFLSWETNRFGFFPVLNETLSSALYKSFRVQTLFDWNINAALSPTGKTIPVASKGLRGAIQARLRRL
jgi:hypothetical protein